MSQSYFIIFGLTADPIHLGHEQAIINGVDYLRQNKLPIKEVLLIPVYQPNLIADKQAPFASYAHRLAMCEIVADRLSQQLDCVIRVSQIEKELTESTGEKNYSFNTIKTIVKNHGLIGEIPAFAGMTRKDAGMMEGRAGTVKRGKRITQREKGMPDGVVNCLFMVSADHFGGRWPKFRQWYKWREILDYSGLLINQRPSSRINHRFIAELSQINPDVLVVQNDNGIDVSSTQIRQEFDAKQAVDCMASDVLNYINEHTLY